MFGELDISTQLQYTEKFDRLQSVALECAGTIKSTGVYRWDSRLLGWK